MTKHEIEVQFKVVQERIIDDQKFCSLEDKDRQIILTKAEGNLITPPTNYGPSSFLTLPSVSQLSQLITRANLYGTIVVG